MIPIMEVKMIGKLDRTINTNNKKNEEKVYYRAVVWDTEHKRYRNLFLTETDYDRQTKREIANTEDCIHPNLWTRFWCYVAHLLA